MSHDPSNPLAIFEQAKSNLPAAPVRDKTAADGMQGGGFPRITLRGSRVRPIIDGKEGQAAPGEYLDVIIVDWMVGVGRLFYEKGYEPNSSEPPTCFSDDGDKAHASSAARQHPTCRGCPHDAENSGQSGRGRACGFAKRLVVQVVGDPHRLYSLDVKGMSIFKPGHELPWMNYSSYAKQMTQHKLDPIQLVTRMHFDTNESVPSLKFMAVRAVTPAEMAVAQKLLNDLDEAERARRLSFAIERSGKPSADAAAASGMGNIAAQVAAQSDPALAEQVRAAAEAEARARAEAAAKAEAKAKAAAAAAAAAAAKAKADAEAEAAAAAVAASTGSFGFGAAPVTEPPADPGPQIRTSPENRVDPAAGAEATADEDDPFAGLPAELRDQIQGLGGLN